jgi:hypothetical protein
MAEDNKKKNIQLNNKKSETVVSEVAETKPLYANADETASPSLELAKKDLAATEIFNSAMKLIKVLCVMEFDEHDLSKKLKDLYVQYLYDSDYHKFRKSVADFISENFNY